MRIIVRFDVTDEEREAIAWAGDQPSLRDQFGYTDDGKSWRKKWRKRKAKRAEVLAYLEAAAGVGLEDLTSDFAGWADHPTEAQAKKGEPRSTTRRATDDRDPYAWGEEHVRAQGLPWPKPPALGGKR